MLEAGAIVGRSQLGERDAAAQGRPADLLGAGVGQQRAVGAIADRDRGRGERPAQQLAGDPVAGRTDDRPGATAEQLARRSLGDDLAAGDDHQPVGDRLDLVQQVRGEQDGAAAIGEVPQQRAHPAHALGVKAVGGLVEDQHLGVAEQRVGDAEPLTHPERVLADALVRGRGIESDELEHLPTRRRSTPISCAEVASTSPPRRPLCWAEASISTPTRRPGLGSSANGSPRTEAWPLLGCASPHSIFRVVDLPAPLGPRNPVTVPGSQRNETSCTAVRPP